MSPSSIKRHYAELGVARDLTSRINARAQELVDIELVHIKKAISDDEIVDVNAQQQKVTILIEQLNISRARRIVMQLLDDLAN